MDEDNDIIIEENTQNIMDEDSDTSNNAIERSTESKCHVLTVGDWKISQFIDNSPNIYHSILNDTCTITQIKPSEILQMEQKYDTFNLFQRFVNNIIEYLIIPLFDELPYYVKDKLGYMGYNWNKCANNEYLNDTIIKYLSRIFKDKYPMVEGLFNTVGLLNSQLAHKIDGQGLCVILCKNMIEILKC